MTQENPSDFWNAPIGHVKLQQPICVKENTSIESAILALQERETGCILVVDDQQKLVGICTERDVMYHFVGTSLPRSAPISAIMVKNPQVLSPDTTLASAINFLGKYTFRHIPIIHSDGSIVGLLSVRSLIKFVAEHLPGYILNLSPDTRPSFSEAAGG